MLHIKISALQGQEYCKNDASIKVDYDTSDPVVRWDSYENFNLHHQDSMESKKYTFAGVKSLTRETIFHFNMVKSNITLYSPFSRYLSYEGPSGWQPVCTGEEATWARFDCLGCITQWMPYQQSNSEVPNSQQAPVSHLYLWSFSTFWAFGKYFSIQKLLCKRKHWLSIEERRQGRWSKRENERERKG